MFHQIGMPEILIILGVVVLLFGGRKLPEIARGSGQALRIFKSEVKGLHGDSDDEAPESETDTRNREDGSATANRDNGSSQAQREPERQHEQGTQHDQGSHHEQGPQYKPDKG